MPWYLIFRRNAFRLNIIYFKAEENSVFTPKACGKQVLFVGNSFKKESPVETGLVTIPSQEEFYKAKNCYCSL